jgi:putative heme-binding domain-containing protein
MRFLVPILARLSALLATAGGVSAASQVSILVPGFSVRELPITLTNVNNLRFTPDGKLSALGYDGRIHLLTDTDGDGLEDAAAPFWDKPTLRVPVGMAWSKDGLYVSSHGKVSLLRDTDGDGRADAEEIVASGWPATDVASGGVDATAVTLDAAGNVYFGLLTANYANPYRVKDGVSRYDLNGPRGTIQKWSPATKQRETIATGIRVPYTLAFNRHGDLFVTDQEGATWCPDGNPLDELNHVIPGRNYGFPPRHDQYLPELVSEPPVVAFGPQHQSACGFVFNEPGPQRKRFGPIAWENDALVAGQSRGKIWRARLVRTPHGYVGRETTIARLGMLTLDVAISPGGDLYVACHSGAPDWGTGPKGHGRLFKISHTNPGAPQPVAIWAPAPMELRVGFDRPIDRSVTRELARMRIEFGDSVSAADRLEILRPPYKVVKAQAAMPRGKLRVVAARLSTDARTLVLTTDPHASAVRHALDLPGIKPAGATSAGDTVDLDYDLSGVEATWTSNGGAGSWTGWLPHLSSDVNAAFTAQSAEHERLAVFLRRSGRLQLRTQIMPPEKDTTLTLHASAPFAVTLADQTIAARQSTSGPFAAEVTLPAGARPSPLLVELETGGTAPLALTTSYSSASNPTARPVPPGALLLPWAMPQPPAQLLENEKSELAGGDYERGRELFFGPKLACATCHQLRGEGGALGPDLGNLVHRDAASVLRDIREPSATINPDYLAHDLRLRDGGSVTGYVRTQDVDTLRVAGPDGKEQIIPRAGVTELRPSPVSLMPPGLIDGLKETQVRDLLTFLLHAPPARAAAEVAAVRRAGVAATERSESAKPLRIVLVASKQDHGRGQHDYPAWQKMWHALLARAPGVTVSDAWEWPSPEQWRTADVVVLFFRNRNWSAERYAQMDEFQQRGGGILAFHAAMIADQEPEQLALRIGLAAQPGPTKYLHTPIALNFAPGTESAVTRGFKSLDLLDEPYWPMFGDAKQIQVLATADIEGQSRPQVWTFQRGNSRVFASIPGHYTWTFEDPLFRLLALRGLAWAARETPARFDDLD